MVVNTSKKSKNEESIAYYDDDSHNYEDFWIGREYEHESEVIALEALMADRHYKLAMDYGGGYGRISPAILTHADKLLLVDPSTKQLTIAKRHLKAYSNVEFIRVDTKDTVPAADNSLDLLVMVRVSHHLPDPSATFAEIYRALKPGGEAIIEIANEAHFVNRLKYLKQLKSVPRQSIPIGHKANGIQEETPFFNHNPKTISLSLAQNRLEILKKLSVSNLRNSYIKEYMPQKSMLAMEKIFQTKLSSLDFGPSIFYLVRKKA